MRKPSTPMPVVLLEVEPHAFERVMPLVHPDDWKTRRVAAILAKSCIPNQWNKVYARKALDELQLSGGLATRYHALPADTGRD